jgi:hypothetical protein
MAQREVNLKLQELIAARPALVKLFAATLPPSLTFRLARFKRQVDEVLRPFDEQRDVLVKQYGTEKMTEAGAAYTFPERDKREAFEAAMKELGEEQVTLHVPEFSSESLGEREILSSADVLTLLWFFNDGEEEEAEGDDKAGDAEQH